MSPARVTWQLWNHHGCESIPRVDNVHVQKSMGMRQRKDYTICVWKNSCIKFFGCVTIPRPWSSQLCTLLQSKCKCTQLLPATLSCVHPTCTCKCNLKVAQINLSSYVCIDTHCTLVGSLLILIVYNATTSHQWVITHRLLHCVLIVLPATPIYGYIKMIYAISVVSVLWTFSRMFWGRDDARSTVFQNGTG